MKNYDVQLLPEITYMNIDKLIFPSGLQKTLKPYNIRLLWLDSPSGPS